MAKSGLNVNIAVTGMKVVKDVVKDLCEVIVETTTDERIPKEVRDELFNKVAKILERMNKG